MQLNAKQAFLQHPESAECSMSMRELIYSITEISLLYNNLNKFIYLERTMDTLRKRRHNYILPLVRTERFKRTFINRCLFSY